MHSLKVDEALYDATVHRLRQAKERLEPTRTTDPEADRICRVLDLIEGRIRASKALMESCIETENYDLAKFHSLHDLALSLADRSENLVRRFEGVGAGAPLVSEIEAALADFKRILDGFQSARSNPA